MAKGIVIAGNLVADSVKLIDSYPTPGMLSSILAVRRTHGGSVPNMGIDLRLMDPSQDTRGVGLVGGDENGAYLLERMASVGLDISGVRVMDGAISAFTDVMTVQATGERTFFHARGANSLFAPEHIDFDALQGCGIFHIAYALLLDAMDAPDAEYGTVMARVLAEATRRGFTTSMDVVSENGDRFAAVVSPSLPHCDYLIINEIEASRICGIAARDAQGKLIAGNIPLILKALLEKGVRQLAVIHAPEGGWCLRREGGLCFRPSLKLPAGWVKGTVGAGDAFCAGVLYALNRDWPIERALDIGAAAAACVLGDQSGFAVKPLAELEALLQTMPRRAEITG